MLEQTKQQDFLMPKGDEWGLMISSYVSYEYGPMGKCNESNEEKQKIE